MPPIFRLGDTMTGEVRPLTTLDPGHLRFYSCGPTVYNYAHIGNFRTFINSDLVVRTAQALGWRVSYVCNITDVGHLTQDDVADASGDDKMAKALKSKEGEAFVNVWDLAEHYADAFKSDWFRMGLIKPLVWPRATQHMREQITAVEELIEKGHAYQTKDAVYFRINSFSDHGKLSGNTNKDELRTAVRDVVLDPEKEHPSDFALWKKDDKHLMQWYSPWGWGFPGWHIECSVMAMKYLGETLDLHAGGEDLIFPHHESEIAQSECLTGKVFSNHWMHSRFLLVDGEKMSKSKGTFYSVRDLVEDQGIDPMALRLSLMAVPYSKPLNFTMQGLADATKNMERLYECARLSSDALSRPDNAPGVASALERVYDEMLEAMCDDMNTSVAIAKALEGTGVIFRESANLGGASAHAALHFLNRVEALLGIRSIREEATGQGDPQEANAETLMNARMVAKQNKDFAAADRLRLEIEALGFEVRDTPTGPVLRRKLSAPEIQ